MWDDVHPPLSYLLNLIAQYSHPVYADWALKASFIAVREYRNEVKREPDTCVGIVVKDRVGAPRAFYLYYFTEVSFLPSSKANNQKHKSLAFFWWPDKSF